MNIRNTSVVFLLLFFSVLVAPFSHAQTVPASRLTDWRHAGLQDSVPVYGNVANIMDYGGVADGLTPNDAAFQNTLNALNNQPGTILFPAGSYLFNNSVNLGDSIVLKGTGTASKLLFDLGGNPQDMINIQGTLGATVWGVTQYISKGDTSIDLDSTTGLIVGDWVLLYGNDSSLLFSSWAYNTVGQVLHIKDIQANKIITDIPLRREYPLAFNARIKRIDPVKGVGIECLYLERKDSTTQQTTNLNFTNAVNCWVIGVESNMTNFAHIGLTRCAHISIRGNYIHHSWHYGGSGQGYGVATQYTSSDCLIENNIFVHLRHSTLLQAGANGNVIAYNYSKDPYWDEAPLPANSAGDAVCHGNYPYLNLYEGNILQNIVVDDSHGINGPFNTFFRNRAQLWGIFMNSGTPTDSVSYAGNEVTNSSFPYGNYTLAGAGHYQFGNNIHGTITPAATTALADNSLYLAGAPGYWLQSLSFPPIGTPYPYNTIDNPAKLRYDNNDYTDCTLNPHYIPLTVNTANLTPEVHLYPNPTSGVIYVDVDEALVGKVYRVCDVLGRLVLRGAVESTHFTMVFSNAPAGIYMFSIDGMGTYKVQKQIAKK